MRTVELTLSPEEAYGDAFPAILYQKLDIGQDSDTYVLPVRRSIDARRGKVVVRMLCEIGPRSAFTRTPGQVYESVTGKRPALIVGAGPAGLFAALRLIELGVRPIILERGKDVQSRRRDLALINKEQIVNPESNYCFGEGGAGTYSDGKLYTRSTKRGDINRILDILVAHGAKEEIRFDAHPHIGTNKLPKLVTALRETIENFGGEVRFNCRVADLVINHGRVDGLTTVDGETIRGQAVILATGHSARDMYELLHRREVRIESKPFALGVRVEHQQELIDRIQYHCETDRGPWLPASSYALVHQATVHGNQRGVFSFCMCPGGFIVPAATAPGEVVVNGMSPSRRDSRFANSGIVAAVDANDFKGYERHGPLAGMYFQSDVEKKACSLAGNSQHAPAQRLLDFIEGRVSSSLLETSYQPGLTSVDLAAVLPSFICDALRQGFRAFGKKMNGYLTNDAQIVGVESRTSSPVKIPRDRETLQHPDVQGLFPCGEGAGFAGGIVSAAMDGEKCAEAAARFVLA